MGLKQTFSNNVYHAFICITNQTNDERRDKGEEWVEMLNHVDHPLSEGHEMNIKHH